MLACLARFPCCFAAAFAWFGPPLLCCLVYALACFVSAPPPPGMPGGGLACSLVASLRLFAFRGWLPGLLVAGLVAWFALFRCCCAAWFDVGASPRHAGGGGSWHEGPLLVASMRLFAFRGWWAGLLVLTDQRSIPLSICPLNGQVHASPYTGGGPPVALGLPPSAFLHILYIVTYTHIYIYIYIYMCVCVCVHIYV